VTGDIDTIVKIYSNVNSSDILGNVDWSEVATCGYVNNADPLWNLIQKNVTDQVWANVQSASGQMCVATVDFQTSNTVYFHTKNTLNVTSPSQEQQLKTTDDFRRAILASACEPCFMPTVHIQTPNGIHQFVDGGVRDYAPISIALQNGVQELYVIILSPAGYHDTQQTYQNLDQVLMRTIELLTDAVGTQNISIADQSMQSILFLNALQQSLVNTYHLDPKVVSQLMTSVGGQANPFANYQLQSPPVIIRPELPLTFDSLSFNQAQMCQMIQTGYDRAKSVVV
jgi:hypothetical protein